MRLKHIALLLAFAGLVACTKIQEPRPAEANPDNGHSSDPSEAPLESVDPGPESSDPAGTSEDPSAEPLPDYMLTGLPVVNISTNTIIRSRNIWVAGKIDIIGNEKYPGLEEMDCEIKGRGNSTWAWPKKPYSLRLSERSSVLGMPKHKRWVLLANFMDRTLQRNLVSMHVASLTSLAWSPKVVPVELVLNGKHKGTYLLCEQVRVDKNRVAITEMTSSDISGNALTGGYLFELDFHEDNYVQWRNRDIPFGLKYPDDDEITPEQAQYAKDYIAEVADVLYGPDFADPEKGYAKYLDVDSFVDYWIVFEVMGNHELGNPGSVFFHKDRGGKLVAGPVWDFDWGVLSYNTSPHARTGLVNSKAIWYKQLFKDPVFKQKVIDRFDELLPSLREVQTFMAEAEKLQEASAELNFEMWDPAGDSVSNSGNIINGDENMSYHKACNRLRTIYAERLNVIPKALRAL